MCQELKTMKNRGLISKTLFVKLLCSKEFHNDVYSEIEIDFFSKIEFDYIDIEKIIQSEIPEESKDNILRLLISRNRVVLCNQLIRILTEYKRVELVEEIFDNINNTKDRLGLLRLISYTNKKKMLNKAAFLGGNEIIISLGKIFGNTIVYDLSTKKLIYRDFIGTLEDFNKFYSMLKSVQPISWVDRYHMLAFWLRQRMFANYVYQQMQ